MVRDQFLYALVSESELNDLVSGRRVATPISWPFSGRGLRQSEGQFGVLWKEVSDESDVIRPIAIIANPSDHRRLFVRFAQIRSDFSPLSTWCHVLSPDLFAMIEDGYREAHLGGYEAAWAGLAVAEATILANRPTSQVRLAACLSTQTFALVRSLALWPQLAPARVLEQYNELLRSVRPVVIRQERLEIALQPVWTTLAALGEGNGAISSLYARTTKATLALHLARQRGIDEVPSLQQIFQDIPEAEFLQRLPTASAEERLRQFDALIGVLSGSEARLARSTDVAFLAGYLATIAAGGSASLSLASDLGQSFPEVSAWAHVIGGLGERVTWTGGFDGLGRLIVRETMRPFWIGEPPSSDFSADEAKVLVDKALSDPLVFLRIKQSRIATAALYPGVNLQIPLADSAMEQRRTPERHQSSLPSQSSVRRSGADELLAALADALLPLIIDRIQHRPTEEQRHKPRAGRKGTQRGLPFRGD